MPRYRVTCTYPSGESKSIIVNNEIDKKRAMTECENHGGSPHYRDISVVTQNIIDLLIQKKNSEVKIEEIDQLLNITNSNSLYSKRKYRIDKINKSELGVHLEPVKESGKIIKFVIRSI